MAYVSSKSSIAQSPFTLKTLRLRCQLCYSRRQARMPRGMCTPSARDRWRTLECSVARPGNISCQMRWDHSATDCRCERQRQTREIHQPRGRLRLRPCDQFRFSRRDFFPIGCRDLHRPDAILIPQQPVPITGRSKPARNCAVYTSKNTFCSETRSSATPIDCAASSQMGLVSRRGKDRRTNG